MLAERVTEWTHQWKQEGFEEGLEKGLEKGREEGLEQGLEEGLERGLEKGQEESLGRLRGVLLREMEDRFGKVSASVRGKVAAMDSIEEIAKLIARTATAPSLDIVGL